MVLSLCLWTWGGRYSECKCWWIVIFNSQAGWVTLSLTPVRTEHNLLFLWAIVQHHHHQPISDWSLSCSFHPFVTVSLLFIPETFPCWFLPQPPSILIFAGLLRKYFYWKYFLSFSSEKLSFNIELGMARSGWTITESKAASRLQARPGQQCDSCGRQTNSHCRHPLS